MGTFTHVGKQTYWPLLTHALRIMCFSSLSFVKMDFITSNDGKSSPADVLKNCEKINGREIVKWGWVAFSDRLSNFSRSESIVA